MVNKIFSGIFIVIFKNIQHWSLKALKLQVNVNLISCITYTRSLHLEESPPAPTVHTAQTSLSWPGGGRGEGGVPLSWPRGGGGEGGVLLFWPGIPPLPCGQAHTLDKITFPHSSDVGGN